MNTDTHPAPTTGSPTVSPPSHRRHRFHWRSLLARVTAHPASILFLVLLLLCIVLSVAEDNFLTRSNWIAIGLAIAVTGIAATGQTLVIVGGGLDLSMESTIALTSVVMAVLMRDGHSFGLSLAAAIVVGVAIGVLNGVAIAVLKVNAIIATLGSLTYVRGIARLYSDNKTIVIKNDTLKSLALDRIVGIPLPVVVLVFCALVGSAVLLFTRFGRNLFLMGDNLEAARLAGVRIPLVQISLYALSGLFAAIAGVIFTAKVSSGLPFGANGYSLTIIAAVILGGASLSGGVGKVSGTIVGVVALGVIDNGLVLLDINTDWQFVIIGIILVVAVALDQLRARLGPS